MRDDVPPTPAITAAQPPTAPRAAERGRQESAESRLVGWLEDGTRKLDPAEWIDLDRINFTVKSSNLERSGRDQVALVAEILTLFPTARVTVAGHTDNMGEPTANQILSQQRAMSVRDALVGLGIGAERITAVGLGDTAPVADNTTPRGRARNRRIAIQVTAR